MKRKFLAVIISSALLVSLAACGSEPAKEEADVNNIVSEENTDNDSAEESNENNTVIDNRNKNTVTDNRNDDKAANDETVSKEPEFSDEDFEKREYIYEDSLGSTLYFVIIKNNSDAVAEINGNALAKDADGNTIGAADSSIDVLGPGEESGCYFYFNDVSDVNSVECTYSYSESDYYYPVISDLSVEQVLNDSNVTVSVTNNGTSSAQFVEVFALFLDADNNMIGYNSRYATDGDSEIKPGSTQNVQLDAYNGYDHVEIFLTGRSDGETVSDTVQAVDADEFETNGYLYENSIGSSYYFVTVKNTSEETVSIDINGTAKDEAGNNIGAASGTIDVLAAGEESICSLFFGDVSGILNVEYQLNFSEESFYTPVIENLEMETSINANNVILTVTNKGDYAAEFVKAYVLFLDANNNLIDYDETYVTDDDSEIKAGASVSGQFDTRQSFDHIAVYLTGRAQ